MSLSPFRDTSSQVDSVATLPVGKSGLNGRMQSVISGLHPDETRHERRRERRYPYPCLLRLSPFDENVVWNDTENDPMAMGITVVGHEVSLNGIGFYHQEPITDRLVVIEFSDEPSASPLRVVVDLTWCRFSRKGWYESGGRLVRDLGA